MGAASTPATQSLTATYDSDMPEATFPSKPGFTFKGFYTGKDGSGTQYYNNVMVSQRKSPFTSNTTLYAYWVDENDNMQLLPTAFRQDKGMVLGVFM